MKTLINIDSRVHGKRDELIDKPVIIKVNEFTEKSADEFSNLMTKAHNTKQTIIPIVIDSYGGAVHSLLSMISDIQNSRLPVATIVQGKGMSCGCILASMGTAGYRYVDKNAIIMLHEVSHFDGGKTSDLKTSVSETERLQKVIFHLMAKNCGHPKNYFLNLMKKTNNVDLYLTPQQAVKHNLANVIKVPEFQINVKVETTFG